MKVLTVLFLIYYIYQLFRQGGFLKTSMLKLYELLPKDSLQKNMFDNTNDKEVYAQGIKTIMTIVLYLIVAVVEFIYIIIATKHGSFAVAYLVFWIFVLLYAQLRKSNVNNLTIEESKSILNKFSVRQFIYNVVDVAYFGYMFYILFL